MKKKSTPANQGNQPVQFTRRDAGRVAKVVHAYEHGRRPANPSSLPRAAGGGGGGIQFRICQFSGPWPNTPGLSGEANVQRVTLYSPRSPQNGPNDFIPDGTTVFAINLFSYIPTKHPGDQTMWGLVMPLPGTAGSVTTGSTYGSEPVVEEYDQLWLLVAAEC